MVDPEPSLPPPCFAELQYEPTVDREPESTEMDEPSPRRATQLRITPEPEPQSMSVQVRKLTFRHATVEVSVGSEGMEDCPTHHTIARVELRLRSEDMPCLLLRHPQRLWFNLLSVLNRPQRSYLNCLSALSCLSVWKYLSALNYLPVL